MANSAELRCGGDLDLPMTDLGHEQATRAAEQVARLDPPVGLIVTSDLCRTRETAETIARHVPAATIRIEPAFAERRLGGWNLMPIRDTQAWLESYRTPPGGESEDEFVGRVTHAVRALEADLSLYPLLVASKGVARVIGRLVGLDERLELPNGAVFEFDLSARKRADAARSTTP